MEFAVNYSPILAELVQRGQIALERFKCPAWPELLAQAAETRPVYIHFPLDIGWNQGTAFDGERNRAPDLAWYADLMAATHTPYLNTHLFPWASDYPGIALDSRAPQDVQRVVDGALRDLEPLVRRFGAERVIVENAIPEGGRLAAGVLPETLHRVLEKSGCGFLLDLSHARLAARGLGLAERAYIDSLPVDQMREMHVTGLQVVEGRWLDLLHQAGDPGGFAARQAGRWMDHLPMTEEDWRALEWAMQQVQSERWQTPWVVSYEYGGVGGFWEIITERQVYLEQLPRMVKMVTASGAAARDSDKEQ